MQAEKWAVVLKEDIIICKITLSSTLSSSSSVNFTSAEIPTLCWWDGTIVNITDTGRSCCWHSVYLGLDVGVLGHVLLVPAAVRLEGRLVAVRGPQPAPAQPLLLHQQPRVQVVVVGGARGGGGGGAGGRGVAVQQVESELRGAVLVLAVVAVVVHAGPGVGALQPRLARARPVRGVQHCHHLH